MFLAPIIAFTVAHHGLRDTMLWMVLGVFLTLKSPGAPAPRAAGRFAAWARPAAAAAPAATAAARPAARGAEGVVAEGAIAESPVAG